MEPPQSDAKRRLEDLVAFPREGLDTEIKPWLDLTQEDDKANIAQAILALANFGGGYILLGFEDQGGTWVPAAGRPATLETYTQDAANGIVQRYAEPPFHCDLHHVSHPKTRDLFPVVVVPGTSRVPVRSKRDGPNLNHVRDSTYYTRGPGPCSRPIQSGREWDDLIRRCLVGARSDLVRDFRAILYGFSSRPEEKSDELVRWIEESKGRWKALIKDNLSAEQLPRYQNEVWNVAYAIAGEFSAPTPERLLTILERAQGRESGWPPWWVPQRDDIKPYPYGGLIECWMAKSYFSDVAHADFWRASPQGLMFLLRGYEEDGVPDRFSPRTVFDLTIPIWRIGECLLHAERLASELSDQTTSLRMQATWEGLAGRTLVTWTSARRSSHERKCRQNAVTSELEVPVEQIRTNLADMVGELLRPLYRAFDFLELAPQVISEELAKMMGSG